jgi:hypothetical protein
MLPTIIKWIIVVLSFVNAAYMTFDGARALMKGDYLRPESGEYAGQLGPWSRLVEKLGIDPMSSFMKSVFLVFGIVGLIITTCFALDVSWAWKAMMIFSIASAWNLFMGTASSVLLIILLIFMRVMK